MTHDELASLEPVIGDAWEHWDHQVGLFVRIFVVLSDYYVQRRMHYEKQAVVSAPDGGAGVPGASSYSIYAS